MYQESGSEAGVPTGRISDTRYQVTFSQIHVWELSMIHRPGWFRYLLTSWESSAYRGTSVMLSIALVLALHTGMPEFYSYYMALNAHIIE